MNNQTNEYENPFIKSLKTVIKRKLLFLILAAIIAIVSSLYLGVIRNKSNGEYLSNFTFTFSKANAYTNTLQTEITNLVTLENLNEVKATNTKFKSINVDKIIKNNAIAIEHEPPKDGSPQNCLNYTLVAKSEFFSSADVAAEFIKELINLPLKKVTSMANELNYNSSLQAYLNDDTSDLYDKVGYLSSQYSFIISSYNKLINENEGASSTLTAVNLNERINNVSNYFNINSFSDIRTEIKTNGFTTIKDTTVFDKKVDELTVELERIEKQIDTYIQIRKQAFDGIGTGSNLVSTDVYDQQINSLTGQKVSLEESISYEKLKKSNANKDTTAIEEKIKTVYYDKLVEFTSIYREDATNIISSNMNISFVNSSIVVKSSVISLPIAIVVGVLLGIIVSYFVTLLVDFSIKVLNEKNVTNNN